MDKNINIVMKHINKFEELNEAKISLKDPKKKFFESVPRSFTRSEILGEISMAVELSSDDLNVDESKFENELKLALQDDKLCQKFVDGYWSTLNACYDTGAGSEETEDDILLFKRDFIKKSLKALVTKSKNS